MSVIVGIAPLVRTAPAIEPSGVPFRDIIRPFAVMKFIDQRFHLFRIIQTINRGQITRQITVLHLVRPVTGKQYAI